MAEVMLRKRKALENIARDPEALRTVHSTAARGQNSAMLVDTNGNRYFAHGASTDIPSNLSPTDIGLRDSDTFVRGGSIPGCEQVLSRNGFMTVSPQLDTANPVRFTQDGLNMIRNGMR